MEFEKGRTVESIMDLLTSREENSLKVLSQISLVRGKLDDIEKRAFEEKNVPLVIASHILLATTMSNDNEVRGFATAFVSHLNHGESVSTFIERYPNYASLDLSRIINDDSEIVSILGPVEGFNLFQLINMEFSIKGEEIKKRRFGRPRKEKVVKEEVKKVKMPSSTTIEIVCDLFPVVKVLFGETGNGPWEIKDGKESINSAQLLELFENVPPISNHVATSRNVLSSRSSLLNRFFKGDTKHRPEEIIKLEGIKMNYYPKDLVKDFLIFATDFLSSEGSKVVKMRECAITQPLDSKKGIFETYIKPIPKLPIARPPVMNDSEIQENQENEIAIKWKQNELINFLNSPEGADLRIKANNKQLIEIKYHHARVTYKSAEEMLYGRAPGMFWGTEYVKGNGDLRTPLSNLMNLLVFGGDNDATQLTAEEQKTFFEENIKPLWRLVYDGAEIGRHVDGVEEICVTKTEYINAIFLLEKILELDKINKAKISLTKNSIKFTFFGRK